MTPGRLIFVNRVYWPSEAASAQLLDELTRALVQQGHEVIVLTAKQANTLEREQHGGVAVHRLGHASGGERRSLLQRAFRGLVFNLRATRAVTALARPGDTCVVLTDPPLLGVGVTWAARRRGARVAQWGHDLYPEVALALCPSRILRGLLRLLFPLRDWSWRQSAACAVLGSDMRARCASRGVATPLPIVTNWALHRGSVPDGTRVRREWSLQGRFVLMYSGNFGRVHAFESLLDLAGRLQHREDIVFVMVGDGPRRAAVETAVQERGLGNVIWRPAQPRERLAETLAAADLHLISLRDGCEGLVWPSKFYGIAAAGRPMVYLGPTAAEVGRLIRQHGLGYAGDHTSAAAAADFVVRLANEPGAADAHRRNVQQFHRTLPGLPAAAAFWSELHRSTPSQAAA